MFSTRILLFSTLALTAEISPHEPTNSHAFPLLCSDVWMLASVVVCTSLASAVVFFFAGAPMAAMAVAMTVRAVLASRSRRRQSPSCLFAHREALLCSAQGCKPQLKPKHWRRLHCILFSCHFADLGVSVSLPAKHPCRQGACSRLPCLWKHPALICGKTPQITSSAALPWKCSLFPEAVHVCVHACVRACKPAQAHICGSGCFSTV